MKRVNRVLLIFSVVIALFIVIIWQVLHSRPFADLASREISSMLKSRAGVELSFEELRFSILPPGIELLHVSTPEPFKRNRVSVHLEAQTLGFYFNILDFMSNRISIKEIYLGDAQISIDQRESLKEKSQQKGLREKLGEIEWSFDDVKKYFSTELPVTVRSLHFSETQVRYNKKKFFIYESEISLYRNYLELKGEVHNLKLPIPVGNSKYVLDTTSFNSQLSQSKLRVKQARMRSREDVLEIRGNIEGDLKKIDEVTLDLGYKGRLNFVRLAKSFSRIQDEVKPTSGVLAVEGSVNGNVNSPQFDLSNTLEGIRSKIINADRIAIKLKSESDKIFLTEGTILYGDRKATLRSPVPFFDMKQYELALVKIPLGLDGVRSSEAFHFLDQALEPLRGTLYGDLDVFFTEKGLDFKTVNSLRVKKFSLVFDDIRDKSTGKKIPLLALDELRLADADLSLNFQPFRLDIKTRLSFANSTTLIDGYIDEKGVLFHGRESKVDLSKLSPIAGVDISGIGKMDIDVSGPFDDVMFDFWLDVRGVEVLEFKLGHVQSQLKLALRDGPRLGIHSLIGNQGKTKYYIDGNVDFEQEGRVNLEVKFPIAYYRDLILIHDPLVRELEFLPEKIDGDMYSSYQVRGGLEVDKLRVDGVIRGENLIFYKELFRKLQADFTFSENKLRVEDILLKKEEGQIAGFYEVETKTEKMKFAGKIQSLGPREFRFYRQSPMGLRGKLTGVFSGQGTYPSFQTDAIFEFKKASVLDVEVPDSYLSLSSENNQWSLSARIFGDQVAVESFLDFRQSTRSATKTSKFDLYANIIEPRIYAGTFFEHNILEKKMQGALNFDLKSEFNVNDIEGIDLSLVVRDFFFQFNNVYVTTSTKGNEIKVSDGRVKKWQLELIGENAGLLSTAGGKIGEDLEIKSQLELDSNLVRLLSSKIKKASGIIKGESLIRHEDELDVQLTMYSNDFFLDHKDMPGVLEKAKFILSLDNEKLLVEEFDGKFSSGDVKVNGSVLMTYPFPDVNLSYEVKNSVLPFFENSHIVLNGRGTVIGKSIPYLVSGDFNIVKGTLSDEFTKMTLTDTGGGIESVRYIPRGEKVSFTDLFEVDLKIQLINPVLLKNSMGEMSFRGDVRIKGAPSKLRVGGAIELIPGTGRFYFKSNDFILAKASLFFYENEVEVNPEVDILAKSRINDYDVELRVFDRVKNFKVELTSTPPLSQEDILSLLALGYTGDKSKDLTEAERQSLASVGIGTFLFERLKINEGLRSSLGLRLSVQPEFIESDSVYISEETGEAVASGSRVKTATKIKVEKKLGEKVDLSVSSTLGSDASQKQEMNLNYNLNKHMSIQGVYEVKSNEEGEKTTDPTSVGADLNIRWSF